MMYFCVFILVPCFYLHTESNVRRTRAKLQLEKLTENETSDSDKQKGKVTTISEQSLDKEIAEASNSEQLILRIHQQKLQQ